MMRRLVLLATASLLTALPAAAKKPELKNLETHDIKVFARAIRAFGPATRPGLPVGKLIWRGGLKLNSPADHFGGFSGLAIGPDGKAFFAASDAGFWMSGAIAYDNDRPARIIATRVGPFRALSGRLLDGVRETDAESVSLAKGTLDNGELLVSFERIHRIGRFPVRNGVMLKPLRYLTLPPYTKGLKSNRGLEGMEALKGPNAGAVIFFAEGRIDSRGHLRGWFSRGGRSSEIFIKPIAGFDITGIAAMPDGGFIVLERRFRWSEGVQMRLRRFNPGDLKPGAVLSGEILLEANSSTPIDNMEGVAIHRDAGGRIVITLISDDNFRFFQNTVLLQFTLNEVSP